MSQAPDDRRDERAAVGIAAKCGPEAGLKAFVVLIDLTVAGCCLFARQASFIVGQAVILHPECLTPLKGTVQWRRGPMTGIKFDRELYPAVFEHLAQTHPWRLSVSAKFALDQNGEVSAAVHRELSAMVDRAENTFRKRSESPDVLTKKPLIMGSRPGLLGQRSNRQLANIFLA
jgi:hypothetical protein